MPWKIGTEFLYCYSHQKNKWTKLEHSNKATILWTSGSIRKKSTFTLFYMSIFKGLHRQKVNGFAFNTTVIQVKKIKRRQQNRHYGQGNACSRSLKISRLFWRQKVPTVFIWSNNMTLLPNNPLYTLTPVSFKIFFFISLAWKHCSLSGPFQQDLPSNMPT